MHSRMAFSTGRRSTLEAPMKPLTSVLSKQRGAETNLYHGGRQQEVLGDYEEELIREMKRW